MAMTIRVNGDQRTVDEPCTVADLLRRLGLAGPCAVEVNARVVPWRRRGEHALAEGDAVEIVTLVGGG